MARNRVDLLRAIDGATAPKKERGRRGRGLRRPSPPGAARPPAQGAAGQRQTPLSGGISQLPPGYFPPPPSAAPPFIPANQLDGSPPGVPNMSRAFIDAFQPQQAPVSPEMAYSVGDPNVLRPGVQPQRGFMGGQPNTATGPAGGNF